MPTRARALRCLHQLLTSYWPLPPVLLQGLPPECAGFIACAGCYMGTDASRPADSDL